MIRMRLGHAGGNGAHAHFGHEFHAHARGTVSVFKIVNELGQILN